MSKENRTNKKTIESGHQKNRAYDYVYKKDSTLLPQKTSSDNRVIKFLKRFNILGISFWFAIGNLFGIVEDRNILEKESHKKVDELQDGIKEKINNMEDNEFYDFAKGIVVYHYNLENPETPISIDQVRIGIEYGSNFQNNFRLKLKERPDGTKYYEKINIDPEKQNGDGVIMKITITDPTKQHTIKKIQAARGGLFRNGDPIEVYEEGEDTSEKSFLTEKEGVYDITAQAVTVSDHKSDGVAKKYRSDLIKNLPSYYLEILIEQIKNESKQVPSERIEGIKVDQDTIAGIEENYGVNFDIDESKKEADIDRY